MSRDLDEQVARRIFELPTKYAQDPYRSFDMSDAKDWYLKGFGKDGVHYDWALMPKYSTSIQDAWMVVGKLREMGGKVEIRSNFRHAAEHWYAEIHWSGDADERLKYAMEHADTAPEAICRAALLAVGRE